MSKGLRAALVSVGAIVVLVLSILIVYSTGQRRQYLLAKGQAIVLGQQFTEYQAAAEKEKAAYALEDVNLKAERDKALALAASAQSGQVQALADLAALQSTTAALPQEALSSTINTRIGANQSWPTAGGVFTFTRQGANATLNLFYQGETDARLYRAERDRSSSLLVTIDVTERERVNLGRRLDLTQGELDKLIPAYVARGDALTHLERSIFGGKVKAALIGAGVGAVIVTVLHIAKVI